MSIKFSRKTPPYFVEFYGRLDNLESLCTVLDVNIRSEIEDCIATVIINGWKRWGTALADHLLGEFSLAIRDAEQNCVFLARDPIGIKPLYYTIKNGILINAFSVAALRQIPNLALTPDRDWMARYMLHMSMSNTRTAYTEVFKVPPGHTLMYEADSSPVLRRYHEWQDNAPWTNTRNPLWVTKYRDLLEKSIRCRMDNSAPMGTENSGGIDSATITAYLAHFLGEPGDQLHSFGFAQCEQEPALILATSYAGRIKHNYLLTNNTPEDIDAQVDQTIHILGQPEEHAIGSAHIPFYKECQLRGIRTLYSGFGGDEVVSNAGNHLRWELLDRNAYHLLWDILPGNLLTRTLRLGKAILMERNKPSFNLRHLKMSEARLHYSLLKDSIAQRLGLQNECIERARYDAPYRSINDFIIQKVLHSPHIATRFENCSLIAAAYGVEYRWPLWDIRLVQQYLSTPSIEKFGPQGIGRYLHRRAINDVVPKSVAWKLRKEMGCSMDKHGKLPNNFQLTVEQARALEAVLHSDLSALIDHDKFKEQIKQAAASQVDLEFMLTFKRSVSALHKLDRWLKGH